MPSMAYSLRQQINDQIIERPVDTSPNKSKQCRFNNQKSIFFIILVILIIPLFYFNFELEFYWSPPQTPIPENIPNNALLNLKSDELSLPKQAKQLQPRTNIKSNLLNNPTEFDLLLSYYSKVSASYYPKSWIHLNEQLFCPIHHSKTLQPHTSISSASERLLKYIYDTQFVADCNDPKHKFIIFDIARMSGTGIGASFNGGILKWFIRAMMSHRIFLIHGKFEWAANSAHCNEFNGMECYFLPPSNCDPINILNHTKDADIWKGNLPKHCTLGDENDKKLPWCTERIILNNQGSSGWYPKNAFIQEWIHSHSVQNNQSLFGNFVEFKSVLQSFIFRLQANVRNIIMNKVKNAFVTSLQKMNDFDPWKSVSFPIRASDKCHKNSLGLNGEMQCWNHTEIYLLLQSIHVLNEHIDTVIFTSEDYDFVSHLIECMHDVQQCDNSTQMKIMDNYVDFEWNVILNPDDTKPSIGNAAFMKYQDQKNEKFQFVDDIGKDMEHDVVVGAFSSMMLQMNSKYLVYTKSSSWLDNVWTMASSLFCESTLWSSQLQINGYDGRDRMDESVQNEFERLETEYGRPSYLPVPSRIYMEFDRYCFELKQFGTLNKKTKFKHILYPPDLWDKIHSLELAPELFYELFGIQIFDDGWDHYCNRYKKPPFDMSEDIGV